MMDKKAAKRVDSIYRNIKQLPLLAAIGFFVGIIGVMLIPIALAYGHLRSKLLRDCASGRIVVEKHDQRSVKPGELTTEQKLEFLQYGDTRMWIPVAVGTLWLLLILVIVISVTLS
ncbi:MAG: hypothetical protein HQ581_09870 [Planctomycetes bacterium]|nr:hypothetical protein [Planctomycetota bacterium]